MDATDAIWHARADCIGFFIDDKKKFICNVVIAFITYKLYLALVVDYEEMYGTLDKEKIIDVFTKYFIYALTNNE